MSWNLNDKTVDENSEELSEKKSTSDYQSRHIIVKGVCLYESYTKFADDFENFEVRNDDLWLCTFPKAGATWTQEMVWCITNDLDYEAAKVSLPDRFPFFDIPILCDFSDVTKSETHKERSRILLQGMNGLPSPRFIKTHLPFHLLPRELREGKKRPKFIHVTRNAKDTCISYYHHFIKSGNYKDDIQQFYKLFLDGKILYGPYWEHLSSYMNQADNLKDQMLFLKYEDMKNDLASVIHKTSEFLQKPKLDTEDLEKLVAHLSIERMRKSPAMQFFNAMFRTETNEAGIQHGFFRCGKVDQWKSEMPAEIIEKFDNWIASNSMSLNVQGRME